MRRLPDEEYALDTHLHISLTGFGHKLPADDARALAANMSLLRMIFIIIRAGSTLRPPRAFATVGAARALVQ